MWLINMSRQILLARTSNFSITVISGCNTKTLNFRKKCMWIFMATGETSPHSSGDHENHYNPLAPPIALLNRTPSHTSAKKLWLLWQSDIQFYSSIGSLPCTCHMTLTQWPLQRSRPLSSLDNLYKCCKITATHNLDTCWINIFNWLW